MNALPGISGSLFPGGYLLDGLPVRAAPADEGLERRRRQLELWWQAAARACGPATGLRALFDLVALPLAGALGFRVRDASFERTRARVRLESPKATAVGLVIRPWATERSAAWRDVAGTARAMGAQWCFLLAPPFLALVDARGHAVRHSVDFLLPEIFDRDSFPRFWTIARARAFDAPAEIDALVAAAARFQDGVRADLQDGVIDALAAFGGVLNSIGPTPVAEALTLVYRLLFLLFAESRDLVPRRHPIYGRAYAIGGFCRAALRAGPAEGLWQGLAAVTRLSRVGCRVDDLIVRPFNGRLFARSSAPSLEAGPRRPRMTPLMRGRDEAMRQALVALSTRPGRTGREPISYADLGVEQLGAVYERVLDVGATKTPRPTRSHSLRRKQTGTFYTPQPLAEFVVRRTLAPLVCAASTEAILALRVVDPAMGSGAFLVAACRYLAAAYERALVDEGRCADTDLDEQARGDIRRLIAERCLAGVDANPTAVQLARLSLWLTTLSRGKPLSFLDHRLRVGNSLIGASPDDLGRLTPTRSRAGAGAAATLPLFDGLDLEGSMRLATRPLLELAARPDDTVDDVRAKETVWSRLAGAGSPLDPWRQAASLWCARWFTTSPPSATELRAALDAVLKGDTTLRGAPLARRLADARDAATEHGFFHWPLEFADVFYDEIGRPRAHAGFDAVIGNPPWEMLRNESGAGHSAVATGEDPASAGRSLVRFIRESGLYPSCDRGHLNLYQPFLERALSLTRPGGRVGLILPWGLATDDGATALRVKLLEQSGLDTIVGLDNAGGLFPIHRGVRFAVVVASPGAPARGIRAQFGVKTTAEIDDLPDRDDAPDGTAYPVRLSAERIRAVGGPARRIPDLRHPLDLALLEHLTRAHPTLGDSSGWAARFGRELNATDDRASFGAHGLPVIEGKHLSPFAVDVSATACRIDRRDAERLLPDARFDRARLAYRDVSGVGNRLSLIAAVMPAGVVTTHTVFCLRTEVALEQQHFLCGLFNSYVLNAVVRLLMGGHVTTSLVEGLPLPPWTGDVAQRRIARLSGALTSGRFAGPALRDAIAGRRAHSALQAGVARLYGLEHEMFGHVLAGFPLVPEDERQRAMRVFSRR